MVKLSWMDILTKYKTMVSIEGDFEIDENYIPEKPYYMFGFFIDSDEDPDFPPVYHWHIGIKTADNLYYHYSEYFNNDFSNKQIKQLTKDEFKLFKDKFYQMRDGWLGRYNGIYKWLSY